MGGSDLEARASGRIIVEHSGVSTWHAEVMGLPNYVHASLGGTHPAGVCTVLVHECLAVVIVFLLAEAGW